MLKFVKILLSDWLFACYDIIKICGGKFAFKNRETVSLVSVRRGRPGARSRATFYPFSTNNGSASNVVVCLSFVPLVLSRVGIMCA